MRKRERENKTVPFPRHLPLFPDRALIFFCMPFTYASSLLCESLNRLFIQWKALSTFWITGPVKVCNRLDFLSKLAASRCLSQRVVWVGIEHNTGVSQVRGSGFVSLQKQGVPKLVSPVNLNSLLSYLFYHLGSYRTKTEAYRNPSDRTTEAKHRPY